MSIKTIIPIIYVKKLMIHFLQAIIIGTEIVRS